MEIVRSAVAPSVVLTVEELLAVFGSTVLAGTAAEAVFVIGLVVAFEDTVPLTEKVATAPLLRLTVVEMFPEPLAAPQDPVGVVTEQDQVTPVSWEGIVSVTLAPVTEWGPLLVTVIV